MTTLVAEMDKVTARHKARAWEDYATIVRRANDPQPGDAERIVEICTLLSIPHDEVSRDAAAYAQMPALVAKAAEDEELTMQTRALMERYHKAEAEAKAAAKKANEKLRALRIELRAIGHKRDQACEAVKRIPEIQERNWRVFAAPKPRLRGEGLKGLYHQAMWDQYLSDSPPSVFFESHAKTDKVSLECLRAAGYTPGPGVNVWSLNGQAEATTEKPTKKKTKGATRKVEDDGGQRSE